MKILVIGSGGREHALAWKLAEGDRVEKVYCLPGNGGTASFAVNIGENGKGLQEQVVEVVKREGIDYVVVGPEQPLADGIIDFLADEGIAAFGPNGAAARIESSKIFAKELMAETGIPTACFATFSRLEDAQNYIEENEPPYVIKADGLAAGKGVFISKTRTEASHVLESLLQDGLLGDAANQVVIEEFLEGPELSFFVLTDGESVMPFGTAHDYKKAYDQNRGPNTGGMGAFSPSPLVDRELEERIMDNIIFPTLAGLKERGIRYRGFLYAGLILTREGPKVLEFNCRLGDPEAQVLLPRLETDLSRIIGHACQGKLAQAEIRFAPDTCLAVIIASGGYPGDYEKGKVINLAEDKLEALEDLYLFHAGTKKAEQQAYQQAKGNRPAKRSKDEALVTAGGRVMAISALGQNREEAAAKAYRGVEAVEFAEMAYRTDIGRLYGEVE
ncbi:MAG: phosphoribosylamine--glycine ligase [Halanaerobium sp.]|nr:phosphoribosylamine--glycine ligase [Halanaerobium sp.]